MTTKSDFAKGTVHKVRDGLLEVTEYHSSIIIDVRFIETGYRTTCRSQHLRNGEVKDRTLLSKKQKIAARAEYNRTRPRFLVTDASGKEHLFNNVPAIAKTYDISRSTVYNIIRGDYGTALGLEIQPL